MPIYGCMMTQPLADAVAPPQYILDHDGGGPVCMWSQEKIIVIGLFHEGPVQCEQERVALECTATVYKYVTVN